MWVMFGFLPDRSLGVREGLREDVGGHQLRVRAEHMDVVGLQLVIQLCSTDAMGPTDVGHIRVLPDLHTRQQASLS